MKKISTLLFTALLFCMASCSEPTHVRVMSYNVRNCKGLDNKLDYDRIANVIKSADCEAIAIQELDSMTARFEGQDMLKNLADLTGMYPTFAGSIDYMGGKYGIGMLTKEKPLSFRRVALPCRSEPRSLLIVELEDYYYCCTHLSLHAEDRLTSVGIIADELSKLDKPVMIAGDFNAEPEEESMKVMAEDFVIFKKDVTPSYTFPADKPEIEIDYICLLKSDKVAKFEVLEHSITDAPIESDHRPIVAEVKIN
ncbi:MAG: endonuclease/exonuclease/phosphatase family protein [Alistipes sp.]|nr:endonuclease/exonuclease/phosphatase family protein [Alistipes sp.]